MRVGAGSPYDRRRPLWHGGRGASDVALFLTVLLRVGFDRVISVASCMKRMAPRGVSMVRRLLVKSALVMFGCLPVVAGGMCKMF